MPEQPWWAHLVYVVLMAVIGVILDVRSRRRQEKNDHLTQKVYQQVNGGGLLGGLQSVRENQETHESLDDQRHKENQERLQTLEDLVRGKVQKKP